MGYSEYDWYNLGTYRTPMKVTYTSNRQDRINAMIQMLLIIKMPVLAIKLAALELRSYVDCSGLIYQCLYAAGINPSSNIVDHALAIHEYTSINLAADNRLEDLLIPILSSVEIWFSMEEMVKAVSATLQSMPEME